MLQTPTPEMRAGRFTKAQIDEMSRGAKITVRVKRPRSKADPIIALISKADDALEEYVLAFNIFEETRHRLRKDDQGWAWVSPVDELIPTFTRGDRFSSETNITRRFLLERKRSRAIIKGIRARLRAGVECDQIQREMVQRVEHHQKTIALIEKYEEKQKKAYRAEERRIGQIQRKVRLVEKREAKDKAAIAVRTLTNKISAMRPTSQQGAIALLSYVELRCRDDLVEFFVERGMFEAKLQRLISRARSRLSKNS